MLFLCLHLENWRKNVVENGKWKSPKIHCKKIVKNFHFANPSACCDISPNKYFPPSQAIIRHSIGQKLRHKCFFALIPNKIYKKNFILFAAQWFLFGQACQQVVAACHIDSENERSQHRFM